MANGILRVVTSLVGIGSSNIAGRNVRTISAATSSGSTLKDLRRIRTESAPRLVDEIVIVVCRSNQLSDAVRVVVKWSLRNSQLVLILTNDCCRCRLTHNSNRTARNKRSNANRKPSLKLGINFPHRSGCGCRRSRSVAAVVRKKIRGRSDIDATLVCCRNWVFTKPNSLIVNPPLTIFIKPRVNPVVNRRIRRSKIEERVSNRAVENGLRPSDDIVGQVLIIQRTIAHRKTWRCKRD